MHESGEAAGQGGREYVIERAVDENEDHAGYFGASIGPGVVGAALYDDVTGAQRDLGFIEYQGDFAGQDDPVVDRCGPVHR